ncbi:DUF4352 domain-containing protein [Streptomyces cinnamoneus]|uniref:DUF4352 domain-containing protein n=1 Tax=Streptomyces cinnamoneus TaxID=53446 RepID=UPI0011AFE247|nr:DUF4352 domain-containing protein [Streptomyces cinnamoneus]
MRRQLATAAVVLTLAVTATACNDGDGTDNNSPDPAATAAQSPASQGQGKDKPAPGGDRNVTVGGTITVTAKNGAKVAVTLKNWVDPAKSNNKFMTPKPGKRWVAAQLEISNTGQSVYDDSPANGVKVLDEGTEPWTHSIGETTSGPNMPATVKLKPGEKALGYVVVSVPEQSKPKAVTFAPDSGFSSDIAQWAVAK